MDESTTLYCCRRHDPPYQGFEAGFCPSCQGTLAPEELVPFAWYEAVEAQLESEIEISVSALARLVGVLIQQGRRVISLDELCDRVPTNPEPGRTGQGPG